MLVLALDTTTRGGSCAVVRDGRILREDTSDPERAHAARLPADLMMLLARTDLRLADIDVFAVSTGPGSFTGLRIGIAAMQGLAFAFSRPLIGVSALDALAAIAGPGRVATWVDAWRGEIYASVYQDGVALMDPIIAHPADLLREVAPSTTFIGDGADIHRDLIEAAPTSLRRVHATPRPALAATIGRIAGAQAIHGDQPAPDTIRPIYVRRPDVELTREARRAE